MYNKTEYHLENCKKAGIKGTAKIKTLKQERISIYNKTPNKCKLCDKPLEYHERKKSFCDSSCSASFNNKKRILSEETKNKISCKLKGTKHETKNLSKILFNKICPECKNEYKTRKKKQIYCSQLCARKNNGCSESAKNEMRIKVQERIKNGTFSGWKSRNGRQPSYPEKYFMNLFDNENITGWIKDQIEGKWFIDFAFIDKKIALEIDGKQHTYKNRKEKDIEKDSYLIENGWKVIRIRWYNPINDNNKEKLYNQIEKFKMIIKPIC